MGLFSNKKKNTVATEEKNIEKDLKKEEVKAKAPETSMKDLYKEETSSNSSIEGGKKKKVFSNSFRILARPLVTEKATDLGVLNKYVFEVFSKANKIEVARAVFEIYGVKPVSVNIVNVKGKVIVRGRHSGKRKDWRKAIVTLPKGKTIKVYEGI